MKTLYVLLLLPLMANAQDSPISKYLASQPATLLDVGMVRLDNLTRKFGTRVSLYWTTASGTNEAFRADINSWYDTKADKVKVHFHVANSAAVDTQMKEGCEMAMQQISIWILKELPGLFLHDGFDNTDEAATRTFQSIADLFEISCYVSAAHDSSVGRFWARRTLRNPDLEIGPWD